MQITYPTIEHIDDLLPALRGREDLETAFIRCAREGFVSLDYVVMIPGVFGCLVNDPDPMAAMLRREARGIKFCARTGEILSRVHPKCFNVGQEAETDPGLLDWRRSYRILEKLDGSMINATPVDGRILFTTRKGAGFDPAIQAFVAGHPADYLGFCRAMLDSGYSPLFEWCSPDPDYRIVLVYPEPKLVLTGLRHTRNGQYVAHDAMAAEARRFGVPVVQTWERNVTDIDAYLAALRGRTGIEGVVIRWEDDGYTVKAKTDDYRRQHQFLEDMQREDKAIELVLMGGEDDFLPTLSAPDAEALRRLSGLVNGAIARKAAWAERCWTAFQDVHGPDRKRFATEVASGHDKFHRSLLLATMNKGDARGQLMRLLVEPQNQSLKSLEQTRAVLELPSWHDLRNGRA
jgi:T4 RnlA family RNA ligase